MSRFLSLPERPTLADVFRLFPEGARPLRQPSPLTPAERKLSNAPARVTDADIASVYAAGWDEHAVSICGLFNMMDRLVEGSGVATSAAVQAEQRARHESLKDRPDTYRFFGKRIGLD